MAARGRQEEMLPSMFDVGCDLLRLAGLAPPEALAARPEDGGDQGTAGEPRWPPATTATLCIIKLSPKNCFLIKSLIWVSHAHRANSPKTNRPQACLR